MLTVISALFLTLAQQAAFPALPPPEAYIHRADQERARHLDANNFPCATYTRDGEYTTVTSLPTDQCYKMRAPQRMRGVWIDEFEGSQFFPNRSVAPPRLAAHPWIWLSVERGKLPRRYRALAPEGRAMLIEFIGRRTLYRVPSGHMGLYDYEIIVDRVISARDVPLRRGPPGRRR